MVDVTISKPRPKHLNVVQIKLPLPGWVSIFHRVSGAGLFICLPVLIWLFGASLGTAPQWEDFQAVVANPLVKLVGLGLVWAFCHHFCAGIRFLLLDMHIGIELLQARKSALAVLVISLAMTAVIGGWLW